MGRPPAITEEEILASARAVFLEKGIAGTTAEVAERCGVSEATVFRRFATKDDLFRMALITSFPEWIESLPDLSGQGEPRAALLEMGRRTLAFFRRFLPGALMLMANPGVEFFERRALVRRRVVEIITAFFEREIRAGRIRKMDPKFAAHLFMGGVMMSVLFQFRGALACAQDLEPQDDFLPQLVDLLCETPAASKR